MGVLEGVWRPLGDSVGGFGGDRGRLRRSWRRLGGRLGGLGRRLGDVLEAFCWRLGGHVEPG